MLPTERWGESLSLQKLARLRLELAETESLLASSRVKYLTRWVLENLRDDLQRQVARLEAELDCEDLAS